jgi:uncharacterized protein YecA (UPF0149 family)
MRRRNMANYDQMMQSYRSMLASAESKRGEYDNVEYDRHMDRVRALEAQIKAYCQAHPEETQARKIAHAHLQASNIRADARARYTGAESWQIGSHDEWAARIDAWADKGCPEAKPLAWWERLIGRDPDRYGLLTL